MSLRAPKNMAEAKNSCIYLKEHRFWKNGKQVNPNDQDLPKAKPIEAKYVAKSMVNISKKTMHQQNYLGH